MRNQPFNGDVKTVTHMTNTTFAFSDCVNFLSRSSNIREGFVISKLATETPFITAKWQFHT